MGARIKGFDGIRALAVLAVFAEHRSPIQGTQIGHAGVLIFFALSGFLIVGLLHEARQGIEANTGSLRSELAHFFGRRTKRIFPIYYLMLTVLALISLAGGHVSGWSWDGLPWLVGYRANTYMGHVLGAWPGSLSHLWSLSIEEWFYILAAPVLLLLPSRFHVLACLAVVGLGIVHHIALAVTDANPVAIYTDSLTNDAFLAFGGALRLIKVPSAGRLALPLIPAMAAMAFTPVAFHANLWLGIAPFLAGLFILAVAQAQESRLVRLLEWAPLAYLGRISYGFYLYHNLFWLSAPLHGPWGVVVSMGFNFAASLALATASWVLIERPLLRRQKGYVGAAAFSDRAPTTSLAE
jgi:peptidoglycan/LPS O-acetylase OafA/YrhL